MIAISRRRGRDAVQMKRSHRFVVLLASAGIAVLIPNSAGAWALGANPTWYAQGNSGGQWQCAGRNSSLNGGASGIVNTANSYAGKDGACSSLTLAPNWIKATAVTQVKYMSGSWGISAGPQTVPNTVPSNSANSSITSSGSTCGNSNWTYRTFNGHEVAVIGTWQNSLTQSPELWWNC